MLSRYISIIFHPSIVTFLGFLVIILGTSFSLKEILVTSFFFSIYPFLVTFILKKEGKVSDLFVTKREERFLPIILSLVGYLIGITLLLPLDIISFIAIAYFVNTLIILLITLKYKISVHVATIAGMMVAIIMVFRSYILLFLLLLPVIVAWARIKEKAHSLGQVMLGGILSSVLTFVELSLFFNLFS